MALGRDGVLMGEKLHVPCPCAVGCVNACVSLPLPCFICSAFCKRVPWTEAHASPASCSVISAH